jgi:hypothetical protein
LTNALVSSLVKVMAFIEANRAEKSKEKHSSPVASNENVTEIKRVGIGCVK